jgi:hypothetical protein
MSASEASAREAARRGRLEQLKVLEKFLKGETVEFKVHDGGVTKLSRANIKPAPRKGGPRLSFTSDAKLLDAAVSGDMDEVIRRSMKGKSHIVSMDQFLREILFVLGV